MLTLMLMLTLVLMLLTTMLTLTLALTLYKLFIVDSNAGDSSDRDADGRANGDASAHVEC